MAAPTLISVNVVTAGYGSSTDPSATGSFAVQAGDLLIALGVIENDDDAGEITISNTVGSDPTWVLRQELQPGTNATGYTALWSGVAPASENITVSFNRSTVAGTHFGGEVHVWRNHDGVGNTAQNNNGTGSGSPTVNITTTADNSGLSVLVNDWGAVATTSTFTNTAGTPIERTDFAGTNYAVHSATYADVSTAGAKTVGMSAPTTQRYQIMVAEILGTAAAPITQLMGQAVL